MLLSKFLLNKKETKPRLMRWILLMQDFDVEIKEYHGVDNVIANHLSSLTTHVPHLFQILLHMSIF